EPAAQEARPPRQQAAVQGVTPERPAPVSAQQPRPQAPRVAEPHPGFINRIFAWLKRDSAAPASPQPPAAPHREQQTPRPERGERGERRGPPPPATRSEEIRAAPVSPAAEKPVSVPAAQELIAQPAPVSAERGQAHEIVVDANPQPGSTPILQAPVGATVSAAPREPDPAEIERALKESGLELVQT